VTDIELQMKSKYGDKMTFIHQEVWVDNDTTKGLRQPLKQFNLPSEPWLFVIDANGKISTAIEGAFSKTELEAAIDKADAASGTGSASSS